MSRWLEIVGFVAFLAVVYVFVLWVTMSVNITHNGPIKWREGWERTWEYLLA